MTCVAPRSERRSNRRHLTRGCPSAPGRNRAPCGGCGRARGSPPAGRTARPGRAPRPGRLRPHQQVGHREKEPRPPVLQDSLDSLERSIGGRYSPDLAPRMTHIGGRCAIPGIKDSDTSKDSAAQPHRTASRPQPARRTAERNPIANRTALRNKPNGATSPGVDILRPL